MCQEGFDLVVKVDIQELEFHLLPILHFLNPIHPLKSHHPPSPAEIFFFL